MLGLLGYAFLGFVGVCYFFGPDLLKCQDDGGSQDALVKSLVKISIPLVFGKTR